MQVIIRYHFGPQNKKNGLSLNDVHVHEEYIADMYWLLLAKHTRCSKQARTFVGHTRPLGCVWILQGRC